MSADTPGVGLDERERHEIDAMLTACLAGVDLATVQRLAAHDPKAASKLLSAPQIKLFTYVHARWGYSGIFEVACAAYGIATHGLTKEEGSPLTYYGNGFPVSDEIQAVVQQFGTALNAVDRFAARMIFDGLQPDQGPASPPSEALQEFMIMVVTHAWQRQSGHGLNLDLQSGHKWPPVCDFCCGVVSEWMFPCSHADIQIHADDGSGPLTIRDRDWNYWYACRTCRKLVEQRPVPWRTIYARLRLYQPNGKTGFDEIMDVMWAAFERTRLQRRAVRLPDKRPEGGAPSLGHDNH